MEQGWTAPLVDPQSLWRADVQGGPGLSQAAWEPQNGREPLVPIPAAPPAELQLARLSMRL